MKDLTQGHVGKQLFLFALPMVVGNLFQQLYSVVDSIVVGKFIGTEALAAVGASFPIIYVLIAMVIGIGSGATVVISQYFGAKKMEEVRRTISTILIFLFFASIVVSFLGFVLCKPLFLLLDVPAEILDEAVLYFRIYALGQIFFFGFNGITSILRGLGDSRTPLIFMIVSTLLNIGLDLLFVVAFNWGIEGVAYATVLSYGITFIGSAIYLQSTHAILSFKIKEFLFDREIFRQSMRIGLPTGFQQTFVAVGMMAILGIVSRFGTSVLAGYTVATRIDAIASMPAMNFGSALSAFVGQNIGAGKIKRIRNGLLSAILLSGLISVSVSALVLVFDVEILRLFTTDLAVIEEGRKYLVIVCSFYLLFSTMFAFHGFFRGAGETLVPMFVTLLALWFIRIPVALYLSGKIGVDGIWWATPLAWGVGLLISVVYYFTGKWKNKGVIRTQ